MWFFRGLGRIIEALFNGLVHLLSSLIGALFQGITNAVSMFVSSPLGIGVLIFGAGWLVFAYRDQDTGAMIAVLGILIAFLQMFRRKRRK